MFNYSSPRCPLQPAPPEAHGKAGTFEFYFPSLLWQAWAFPHSLGLGRAFTRDVAWGETCCLRLLRACCCCRLLDLIYSRGKRRTKAGKTIFSSTVDREPSSGWSCDE